MKEKKSIQLKAALLLILFSLNTIIGFACALSTGMDFNNKHNDEKQNIKPPAHIHADGKNHVHTNKAHTVKHEEEKSQEKDDCCNDVVVKFQNAEKILTIKTIVIAPVYLAIVSAYAEITLYNLTTAFLQKSIIRFFYPPPPDILISIQKLQV